MTQKHLNIYNNFIKLSTNKQLYINFKTQDQFSDRLNYLLMHFAFFIKVFTNKENEKILQEIYDYFFRYLELNIREIGYGDQSINKKMKIYINLFHSILDKFYDWDTSKKLVKSEKIKYFIDFLDENDHLVEYFDNYYKNLKKSSLNSHIKV
jgi:cytochrome b pre-mRNA-processing protein 3